MIYILHDLMYIYIYKYTYVYICTHKYIDVCIYIHICICLGSCRVAIIDSRSHFSWGVCDKPREEWVAIEGSRLHQTSVDLIKGLPFWLSKEGFKAISGTVKLYWSSYGTDFDSSGIAGAVISMIHKQGVK